MVRSRAGSLDLFLDFDGAACPPRSKRATLERQLRDAVDSGRLSTGMVLPSTRQLARDLGLARGTVVEAYGELAAQGYLRTRPGGETTVLGPAGAAGTFDGDGIVFPPIDLRPGAADLTSFPWGQWVTSLRSALSVAPGVLLDYPPLAGAEELRSVLAGYLARSRGVVASADRVVLCSGTLHAIAMITAALATLGKRRIAMEDPCVPRHRAIAVAHGAEIVPIPVDDRGLRVDAVVASDPDAVVLTPAHQYPTGAVLSPERRHRLVAWAQANDRLLVEDDYDAEYRYEPEPRWALQALAPERVVYTGTLSKMLMPGLRMGWLVLPGWFVAPLLAAKRAAGAENSVLDQLAFAEMIRSQRFDRHLRRMRGVFRRRRDRFLAAVRHGAPHLRAHENPAGLHFLVDLPDDGPAESDLLAAGRRAGVALFGLERCSHGPPPRRQGILVGFGRPPEHALDNAIQGLLHVLGLARDPARHARTG